MNRAQLEAHLSLHGWFPVAPDRYMPYIAHEDGRWATGPRVFDLHSKVTCGQDASGGLRRALMCEWDQVPNERFDKIVIAMIEAGWL